MPPENTPAPKRPSRAQVDLEANVVRRLQELNNMGIAVQPPIDILGPLRTEVLMEWLFGPGGPFDGKEVDFRNEILTRFSDKLTEIEAQASTAKARAILLGEDPRTNGAGGPPHGGLPFGSTGN